MNSTVDPLLDITALAAGFRRRRRPLSPLDVTEEFLARLAAHDGAVQAMVTVTADRARAQARRAVQRLEAGDPSPLLGVPVVMKDLIDISGVPTTAGSAVLRENVPTKHAAVWSRLERAGAVLLGKANTHEFAYGGTTEPTKNPWHLGRLVGGSSGGPGAALAAAMCTAAVGTDTAGSIRIPASLCGVFGLKPSAGLVSATGVIPLAPSLDGVGPMGHRPADLGLMLAAMSRRPGLADELVAERRRIRRVVGRHRLRVGVLTNTGAMATSVRAAHQQAARLLGEHGSAEDVTLAGFEMSVMHNFVILGVEAVQVHRQWSAQRHLYTPYVRERLQEAEATRAVDYVDAIAAGRALATHLDELLGDLDVLVVPGLPFAAPPLGVTRVQVGDEMDDRDAGMCRNTAFANLTGHPVLSVPAGFDDGLPVGVQLVGRRGGDAALLAVGEVLAESLAVPTVAPKYRAA